ncbi:MAG: class I SAM-dependent methyltransferase [Planctomycetota bacterium]
MLELWTVTSTGQESVATAWRRGPGIAEGTWRYASQDSIAEKYDDFVDATPICDLDTRLVAAHFPESSSSNLPRPRIADLGCGTGRTAAVLAGRGYDVLGIDLSQSMLRRVNSKLVQIESRRPMGSDKCSGRVSPGRVSPLRGNLVEMQFLADQVVDGAVCLFSTLGMIQGRHHRRQVLSHAERITRPGGIFLLHIHHRYASLLQSGGPRMLAMQWFRSRMRSEEEFGDAVYAYRGLPDMFLHRFSAREIIADLRATHWTVEQFDRLSLDGSKVMPDHWKSTFCIAGGFIIAARKATL